MKIYKREDAKRRNMSMYDALLDSRIERHGGVPGYAAKLGVNASTLWRWRVRDVNPFSKKLKTGREQFQADVGLSGEQLERLSEISVAEACKLVLNHTPESAHELPTPPEPIQPALPAPFTPVPVGLLEPNFSGEALRD